MNEDSSRLNHIDRLGASVSLVCAIHSALTPFAATILPLLGIGFLVDKRVEYVFLAVSLTLAATSACWGVRVHKQRRIVPLFAAALTLILAAARRRRDSRRLSR
jgi:hypothetical protein